MCDSRIELSLLHSSQVSSKNASAEPKEECARTQGNRQDSIGYANLMSRTTSKPNPINARSIRKCSGCFLTPMALDVGGLAFGSQTTVLGG